MNYKDMSANDIKASFGFDVNEIVDPEMLAEKLRIDLCETSLDQEYDGAKVLCAIINKDRSTIFYHKKLVDGQGSEKVAITYALVHCVLCGAENAMITTRTIMKEQEEELIYELLMPESVVTSELRSGESVNSLAEKFGVPKRCVRERLDMMPAILVGKSA